MWYITNRDQILSLPKLRQKMQVEGADQCFHVRIWDRMKSEGMATGRSEIFDALLKKV
jgi:hypothetical protein